MSHLEIVLFGQLDISLDGNSLSSTLPKKAAALVAYLALTGRAHTRQALSNLLWGESSEANARLSLRAAVCSLRRLLAPYLVVTRQTIALNAGCDNRVDALTFVRATAGGTSASGERPLMTGAQASELRAAVDLYGGELMADWPVNGAPAFEEWLMMERQRLQELALRALFGLSAHYVSLGAYDEAIAMARRLLTLEPWQEEAHRQLMELLVLRGRRTEALMQYKTCRRTLMLELGVEPTVETQRLYHDLVSAHRRGDGGSARRTGGALGPSHNLPPQPMPIHGRQMEMAQLKRLLLGGDRRILTLVGAGGVGKTRLAQAVAEDVREQFGDGVWYVPLADVWEGGSVPLPWEGLDAAPAARRGPPAARRSTRVTASEFLLAGIGHALGLGTSGRRLPAAQLLAYLQDRRLLLILDGLEPLMGEPGVLADLVAGSGQTRLLVTCRRRLDLRGEQAVRIGRLEVPEPGANDPVGLSALASVRVFMDWAKREWPEFVLDAANAQDVAEICRMMAGLPLGIALAASMAGHLTAGQIVQAGRADPGQVTARWPDAPSRHRGLQASCQYTQLLLSPEERAALRSLARLDTAFTLNEATGAGVSLTDLRALVEWNLVERVGPGHFFIAPMDRHFALGLGRGE